MSNTVRRKKSDSSSGGAPEWMVTFSDCMTLLLTFFVLVLSFSSFDDKVFEKLRIIFSSSLPAVGTRMEKNKDSFLSVHQVVSTEELSEGSEKPTLQQGRDDTLKKETLPSDFRNQDVFLFSSAKIFWGRGKIISSQGREILSNMAAFLRQVPNRMVISELGFGSSEANEEFGLPRAWAVLDYLTREGELDSTKISLSASGVASVGAARPGASRGGTESERMVEIVILNRSLYD